VITVLVYCDFGIVYVRCVNILFMHKTAGSCSYEDAVLAA